MPNPLTAVLLSHEIFVGSSERACWHSLNIIKLAYLVQLPKNHSWYFAPYAITSGCTTESFEPPEFPHFDHRMQEALASFLATMLDKFLTNLIRLTSLVNGSLLPDA